MTSFTREKRLTHIDCPRLFIIIITMADALRFSAKGCNSHMRYSERVNRGYVEGKSKPSVFPYLLHLKETGAEMAFHKKTPQRFRVRLEDVNTDIPEWKKTVYQLWADLWMLNSRLYLLEDEWDWMQKDPVHRFFAKPWVVTTIGAAKFIEYSEVSRPVLDPCLSKGGKNVVVVLRLPTDLQLHKRLIPDVQ